MHYTKILLEKRDAVGIIRLNDPAGLISANQALSGGLINRVVTEDALDATALELAGQLAAGPTRPLVAIRQVAWAAEHTEWGDTLRYERQVQKDIGRTRDACEGIAAFLQKRARTFTGT